MQPQTRRDPAGESDFIYWQDFAWELARPVFTRLFDMPVIQHEGEGREQCAHLEALGRTLAGVAPYLQAYSDTERAASNLQANACSTIDEYFEQVAKGRIWLHRQNIIDAGYLVQGFIRAPSVWSGLETKTQDRIVRYLMQLRQYRPLANNWILHAALIEVFLLTQSVKFYDPMRIDYAIKQTMQWYKGDSIYGDGPDVQFDYYNSLVVHPALYDILAGVAGVDSFWAAQRPAVTERLCRHAQILERMISPEGTYPVVGRSATYRMGVFNALSYAVFRGLDFGIYHSQVRSGLTAVLKNMRNYMFRDDGWLRVGFNSGGADDLSLAEPYISTGSLYATALFLTPLGKSKDSAFWAGEAKPWTQKRLWNGGIAGRDQSIGDPLVQ